MTATASSLTVIPEDIPASMRSERRWLVWRHESRNRRQTKVPYQAACPNVRASSTHPATWSDYEEALASYKDDKADGIGFALGDGWFGLDRDHCVVDGVIDADGLAMLEALATYAEFSVSGTGIHVIGRGGLPPGPRRREQTEAYDHGRYFTVSGHRVPGAASDVTDCSSVLAAWYAREFGATRNGNRHLPAPSRIGDEDSELIERAMSAANGYRFSRLWSGDTSEYPSHSEADSALCMMLAFWTGRDEVRIDRLFRGSGLMRPKWGERRGDRTYGETTIAEACAHCTEVYGERPRSRTYAETSLIVDVLTEAGAAERFARLHGDDVRFDHRRGRWLLWHGHRWGPDTDAAITRLGLEFARAWQRESVDIPERDRREATFKAAMRLERRGALASMLELAADLTPITDPGDDWDRDAWLLGVTNGVVDLKTGELRPGRPEDSITMQAAVEYDPGAPCERWEAFVAQVLPDPDVAEFVRLSLGYTLTGETGEQCLFFNYGGGSNGKGTLVNTISFVLGDYAYNMPFSAIELSQRGGIPNDLAALDRKRFVSASESNDGTRLNEARVKALTGCDPITARFLHQEFFMFRPMAKFWLAANHRPVVRDDSHGFWRRMRLISFEQQFSLDRTLEGTLRDEARGILAWMVRACLDWQARGLPVPDAVAKATSEYREDSDPLARFLDEACELEPASEVGATDLYKHYQEWAQRAGLTDRERFTLALFGRKIGERFRRIPTRSGIVYGGVARRSL